MKKLALLCVVLFALTACGDKQGFIKDPKFAEIFAAGLNLDAGLLDLSGQDLKEIPTLIDYIPNAPERLKIYQVNFSDNQLAYLDTKILTGFDNLSIVNISDNSLEEIKFSSNVRILKLIADNNELKKADFSNLTELLDLDISSNQFEALKGNIFPEKLETIIANENPLSDISALSEHPNIRKLRLNMTQVDDGDSEVLLSMPNLRSLSVDESGYSEEETEALQEALRSK